MHSLKFSTILVLLPTLITIVISDPPDPPAYIYHYCDNTTIFTSNSTYKSNLDLLLSSLSSNATRNDTNGFYSTSAGLDEVYGLFLCRGDITIEFCQDCVTLAAKDVVQRCPFQQVAFIWYDICTLRYSNSNISSTMVVYPSLYMYSPWNLTVDAQFTKLLITNLNDTITQAANAPSDAKKFAVKTVEYTWLQLLYILVQCTPDLSSSDCYRCLQQANVTSVNEYVSNKGAGGRVLSPSCNLRFELNPFYNETAAMSPPPAPPPAVLPPPPPRAFLPRPKGNGSKRTWIIVGAILSSIVGFASCICSMRRSKILKEEERSENSQVLQLLELRGGILEDDCYDESIQGEVKPQDFHLIRLDALKEATNQFSDENKLGQGGFGPVYKGTLEDGKEIAVKRLSINSGQGLREFMNEVKLIAKLQHKNLVRLVGCCLEKNEKLLVYEYMPNKSLDFFLFDSTMAEQLDWQRRLGIINGIARGLMYLHEDSRLKIIHRDLKASNILLDYEMNPKISDFGMARIFGGNQSEANTNRIVGTFGYMAPEYAMSGLCSVKSDVFSFGVLLLEIVSGKRNGGFHLSEQGKSLLSFAWKLWSEGEGLELMDPLLANSSVATDQVQKCIHIGLLCVQEDAADRPTMSSVVVMLATDTVTLPVPAQPAFSVGRAVVTIDTSTQSSNQNVRSVNEVTLSSVSPR